MPKVLILYFSKSGNTEKMAHLIAEGVKRETVDVSVKPVKDTKLEELLNFEGVVIGSPTYFGSMAAEIKSFLDESDKIHGKLKGKIGGAFSSSANIGGGNETTVMSILKALLIHGMIIQGSANGDHYGPIAIEKPDKRSEKLCIEYGRMIAKLVLRIQ